jgi:hypothetical protein
MRHTGSEVNCLQSTIGEAARLRASEPDAGKQSPTFRGWRPHGTGGGLSRIESNDRPRSQRRSCKLAPIPGGWSRAHSMDETKHFRLYGQTTPCEAQTFGGVLSTRRRALILVVSPQRHASPASAADPPDRSTSASIGTATSRRTPSGCDRSSCSWTTASTRHRGRPAVRR